MVNINTHSIGNFQAGVGKMSSTFSMYMSYVMAVILILLAIGLTIYGSMNVSTGGSGFSCPCDMPGEECKDGQCKNKPKRQLWLIGVAAGLVVFAILIVLFSRWWRGETHRNRTAAQIGGTLAEVGLLQDVLGTNRNTINFRY
jgi:hypothetical protein